MEETFEKAQVSWLKENFIDLKKENEALIEENDKLKHAVSKLTYRIRFNEELLKQQKDFANGIEKNTNLLNNILETYFSDKNIYIDE